MKFIIGKTYYTGIFLMVIMFFSNISNTSALTIAANGYPQQFLAPINGAGARETRSRPGGICWEASFFNSCIGASNISDIYSYDDIEVRFSILAQKTINIYTSAGRVLSTSSNTLPIGTSLSLSDSGTTVRRTTGYTLRAVWNETVNWTGPEPISSVTNGSSSISSSNGGVVSCSGTTCSAVGPGSAIITVNSNTGYLNIDSRIKGSPAFFNRRDSILYNASATTAFRNNIPFSYSSRSFPVTVFNPQQAPTVRYTSTTSISYNNATSNWSYSDANGDIPRTSTVRYYTDAARTVLGASETVTGNVRSATESGLRAGTTYWPTVFVNNGVNTTVRADGNAFTTRSYSQSVVTFNVVDRNGGETIAGDPIQFQWTVTNTIGVASCTAFTGGNPNIDTNLWNGNKPIGANRTENRNLPRSQVQKTYTFRLRCTPKPGGPSIPDAVKTITVKGTPSILTFTVNESTTPTAITAGQSVRLEWRTTNSEVLTGCTASTGGNPSPNWNNVWSGDKARNGNQTITIPPSQINRTYSFVLTCNPVDGNSPTRTISLSVTGTPATTTLTLNTVNGRGNNDLRQGDTLAFVWTTTNPQVITNCQGNTTGIPDTLFSGEKDTNGGTSIGTLPDDIRVERAYTFRLTCNVVDGAAIIKDITATVKPKPPISCNLVNTVVSERNKNIVVNFTTDPKWTGPYSLILKRGFGSDILFTNTTPQRLDYTDIVNRGLGKYDLKARLIVGGIESDEVNCGTVTSLGDRTIREVAP